MRRPNTAHTSFPFSQDTAPPRTAEEVFDDIKKQSQQFQTRRERSQLIDAKLAEAQKYYYDRQNAVYTSPISPQITTRPRTVEELFHNHEGQAGLFSTEKEYSHNARLNEAQDAYPDWKEITPQNYGKYHVQKYVRERHREDFEPLHTAKQLFETAYNWKPFAPDGGRDLLELLDSNRFERITLGKLRGEARLDLIPGLDLLPSSKLPPYCTRLGLAYTNGAAISYANGHPSGTEELATTAAAKDGKLRRFMPLGSVIEVDSSNDQDWKRTGHVLVMDMDEGRERHPWIVLAAEWHDDCTESTIYAEKHVAWNDHNAHGVLSGDRNRIPIARICNSKDAPVVGPMLLQFSSSFEFDVTGHDEAASGAPGTGRGPDLVHIMDWYIDREENEEVCYSADGNEYMRYNRQTKEYRYPAPDSGTWRQQVGMNGQISSQKKVSIVNKAGGMKSSALCKRVNRASLQRHSRSSVE